MSLLRRVARFVGVVAAILGVAAGVAWATGTVTIASSNTLHACAAKVTGVLRLIGDGDVCRPSEQAVEWNIQGPAGPAGPAGPPGPQGDPGPSGPAGASLTTVTDLNGLDCTYRGMPGKTVVVTDPTGMPSDSYSVRCMEGPDQYEPNNTEATATPIAAGQAGNVRANLDTVADVDWYAISPNCATYPCQLRLFVTYAQPAGPNVTVIVDGVARPALGPSSIQVASPTTQILLRFDTTTGYPVHYLFEVSPPAPPPTPPTGP